MMDPQGRAYAEHALRALDTILDRETAPPSREVSDAIRCVFALRNHVIERARRGDVPRSLVDRANAISSLAHGAENPVIGLHRNRLQSTRDEVRKLLENDGR